MDGERGVVDIGIWRIRKRGLTPITLFCQVIAKRSIYIMNLDMGVQSVFYSCSWSFIAKIIRMFLLNKIFDL